MKTPKFIREIGEEIAAASDDILKSWCKGDDYIYNYEVGHYCIDIDPIREIINFYDYEISDTRDRPNVAKLIWDELYYTLKDIQKRKRDIDIEYDYRHGYIC